MANKPLRNHAMRGTMARVTQGSLIWNSERVSSLLKEHDIVTRQDLVARVPGVSRATLYRAFNDEWHGKATTQVVIAMCRAFDVPLARLVYEPRGHEKSGMAKQIDYDGPEGHASRWVQTANDLIASGGSNDEVVRVALSGIYNTLGRLEQAVSKSR